MSTLYANSLLEKVDIGSPALRLRHSHGIAPCFPVLMLRSDPQYLLALDLDNTISSACLSLYTLPIYGVNSMSVVIIICTMTLLLL